MGRRVCGELPPDEAVLLVNADMILVAMFGDLQPGQGLAVFCPALLSLLDGPAGIHNPASHRQITRRPDGLIQPEKQPVQ